MSDWYDTTDEGSYYLDEAKEMARKWIAEGQTRVQIAVIHEQCDRFCEDIIKPEDF